MRPFDRLFRLDGKVALVTGDYGGIGAVICDGLAQAAAKVAVAGHNAAKAQTCADRLRAAALVRPRSTRCPSPTRGAWSTRSRHTSDVSIFW